jgi:phosphoribosylformylglycinamidine (FGAM) synthase-like enzyme
VPRVDAETNIEAYRRVLEAMDKGLVRACHDCSEGGLAVAVAEMAFTGGLGVDVDIGKVPVSEEMRDDLLLFSESNGRLLVEVPPTATARFTEIMRDSPNACVGAIKADKALTVTKDGEPLFEIGLETLMGTWKTPLEAGR